MSAMSELSMLVEEAGLRAETMEELQVACAKELLAKIQRPAALQDVARMLNMHQRTRDELASMVWLTYEQAVALRHGDILHHVNKCNSDGTPMRVRVTGKCQTWKTRPGEFKLPVKYGMYESGYLTAANRTEWYVA